jgi:S-adenosylmethionine decarboxylase
MKQEQIIVKEHKSPEVGQEISCVMTGIEDSILKNNRFIKEVIVRALNNSKFNVLNLSEHEFTPYGYTMMVLLSESHLAIHTYPEYNAIYFSLYTCRGPKDAEKTFKLFKQAINPKEINFVNNNQVPLI